MDTAFLLFLPCVLWGVGFSGKGFREDYLSVMSTKALKGILAVLVVLHHMSRQMEGYVLFLLDNVGVLCVSAFFFLSGYGLQKSYCTKPGYRSSILRRRIPSVLVPYLILNGIYWLFEIACGNPLTLAEVARSWISGNPLVNYSWYVLCILAFYVNYYASTFLFAPGGWGMGAYHVGSVIGWAALCRAVGYNYFWYTGAIAFPLGILWVMGEKTALPSLRKHFSPALAVSAALFGGTFLAALYTTSGMDVILPLYWAAAAFFLLTLLLVLMKFSFRNRLLLFLGEISFEIYGIHGLFLRLYRGDWIYIGNDTLWCAAVIGSSVAAAWGLHSILAKGSKRLQRI